MQALHRKLQGESVQLRHLLAGVTHQQEEKAAREQAHKEATAKRRDAHRHPLKVRTLLLAAILCCTLFAMHSRRWQQPTEGCALASTQDGALLCSTYLVS